MSQKKTNTYSIESKQGFLIGTINADSYEVMNNVYVFFKDSQSIAFLVESSVNIKSV